MTEFIITCESELQKDGSYKIKRYRELVRCKDCKFGEACKNGRGEHGVMCYNSHSASHSWVHEPDWFCADGKRRECVKPVTRSATDWDGVECE